MDDVTRALEKAAEASATVYDTAALEMNQSYKPQGACDVDRNAARAAVLACVKSLPPTMTIAELTAAIEKERP